MVRAWLAPGTGKGAGNIVVLIKPQFEAGKRDVRRGKGVIRDAQVHRQVLLDVLTFAESQDLGVHGLQRSPLLGPKGNVEFLGWLAPCAGATADVPAMIEDACAVPAQSQN
jgi:23S rRNA (cytidine1920-2'-O)/16S rRNA (cytidine1409-2'-O)-methyltransferase